MIELLDGTPLHLPRGMNGTVVTVGTFDGVHRGHLDVVTRLVARSRAAGLCSLVVTFNPHPLELLNPAVAPLLLTTREEKGEALASTGLDYLAVLPFDRALADLTATEFVDRVLLDRLHMRELLIGHDHGFGRGREGDVQMLRTLGAERGFLVDVVPPVQGSSGDPVSSSAIRLAVAAGELDDAAASLGRRYAVSGLVVPGDARGRTLGFPTLNVLPGSPRKLLPPDGVYAVEVRTERGTYGGMLNLGGRPTFSDDRRTVEVHLFDTSGDFYGDVVQVGFVARLRDTMRFDGPDELMAQLAEDERSARLALTASGKPGNLKGSMQFPPSTP